MDEPEVKHEVVETATPDSAGFLLSVAFRMRAEGGRILPFILGLIVGALLWAGGQSLMGLLNQGG